MKYRNLGRSGMKVSEIGLGCWAIGGPSFSDDGNPNGWAGNDDTESLKGLFTAYEKGVNHWDTADVYGKGHSERLLGKAFRQGVKRENIILASKIGWFKGTAANAFDPLHLRHQIEQSLKNLGTDYLDIYYFHNPYFGENDQYLEEAAGEMQKIKQEGKTRFVGQSAYTFEDFVRVSKVTQPDIIQLPYNAMNSPFDTPENDIFKWADSQNLGIVVFGSYAKGLLLGKYDRKNPPGFDSGDIRNNVANFKPDFLEKLEPALEQLKQRFGDSIQNLAGAANQYVLMKSPNAVPIPGFKNSRQVEINAQTSGFGLSEQDFDFISTVFESFKS